MKTLPLHSSRFQSVCVAASRQSAGIFQRQGEECGALSSRRYGSLARLSRAFSLVEILIVMALLSVIVLGLMAMFGQTQRAFRLGMAQTDVLEAGRAATDLIGRELGELRASGMNAVNFDAQTPGGYVPLLQGLPGEAPPGTQQHRTNVLQDLFFLRCSNRVWTATGYRAESPDSVPGTLPAGGVGTLYRYTWVILDTISPASKLEKARDYFVTANTNWFDRARVADGVVHLRVRAYDTNGVWLAENTGVSIIASNRTATAAGPQTGEVGWYQFWSNAVPGAVEIELGFLEARTLERANAIPATLANDAARRNYLSNHVGQVHLFRQRIPVPTVDVRAYQ